MPGAVHLRAVPQSLSKILLHVVFSTKERRPFLRERSVREEMHKYIGGILKDRDCPPIIVGGVEDHVHALFVLPRTSAPADVVKEMKRGSSLWIKSRFPDQSDFAWQHGYGIFSIGYSQLEDVRRYIAEQEQHHAKVTFQEEFRRLLQRYEIVFDEAYVWD